MASPLRAPVEEYFNIVPVISLVEKIKLGFAKEDEDKAVEESRRVSSAMLSSLEILPSLTSSEASPLEPVKLENIGWGKWFLVAELHAATDEFNDLEDWPRWLRPSTVDLPDKAYTTSVDISIKAVVKKKRPLIYVYDLPPEFNNHLLEFECVNKIYTDQNRTLWTKQLYGLQMALYESILSRSHRTLNGEEADYFYVPILDSCLITRVDDVPHLSMNIWV